MAEALTLKFTKGYLLEIIKKKHSKVNGTHACIIIKGMYFCIFFYYDR